MGPIALDSPTFRQTERSSGFGVECTGNRAAALDKRGKGTDVIQPDSWTPYRSIETLFHDVRWGLRSLRKRPGFVLVAVAMLGLGIGINVAIFTIVNAALFKGFRLVERNDRIVQIGTTKDFIYYPDFVEWRSQAHGFHGMALVRGVFHTLSDHGNLDVSFTYEVTANTFQLLGVTPFLGRDFVPADEQAGSDPVVMLRYELWVRRFAADPRIIGKTVRLDGIPTTVIGVMPAGFSFPADQELWTPLVPTAAALRRETSYARYAYGRLADTATLETVRAELGTIGRRLASAHPRTNEGVVPVVRGFDEWFVGAQARALYQALWGAVGCVLLIVCANVANLLVLQAMGRSQEMSVRLALGARRWRLISQFLIEGLLLSFMGGVIGWWVAHLAVQLFALVQVNSAALALDIDDRVLVYLASISTVTGLAAGLATATHLTRLHATGVSKEVSRTVAGGRSGARVSDFFVGAQVALAVVLLVGAGVTIRSFVHVSTANVGVDAANVLTASLYLPPERYVSTDARVTFYRDLGERLQGLPGVEAVGFGATAPTENAPRVAYELADAPVRDDQPRPMVTALAISGGYFHTLRGSIVAGRDVQASDRASALPVAIVNRRFADLHWPGQSPLGKRLRFLARQPGTAPTQWLTVVGVATNIVQNDRTRQAFEPLVYVPYGQQPQPNMFAFARSRVPPSTLAAAVRREVYAMDPDLPVPALEPLSTRFERAYALERNTSALLFAFALIALLLAAVGLYAVIAHAVNRRRREIGVRLAIGASGRDILALVFARGMWAAAIGLPIGLTLSLAVNQLLKAQLVGVSPADPIVLAAASLVLVLAAAFGCWIPARRAMGVDPVIVLKHE